MESDDEGEVVLTDWLSERDAGEESKQGAPPPKRPSPSVVERQARRQEAIRLSRSEAEEKSLLQQRLEEGEPEGFRHPLGWDEKAIAAATAGGDGEAKVFRPYGSWRVNGYSSFSDTGSRTSSGYGTGFGMGTPVPSRGSPMGIGARLALRRSGSGELGSLGGGDSDTEYNETEVDLETTLNEMERKDNRPGRRSSADAAAAVAASAAALAAAAAAAAAAATPTSTAPPLPPA